MASSDPAPRQIVSTADSFLLVPATNLARDVYVLRVSPNASSRRVIAVTRLCILAGGLAAYVLSDQFPTVLAAANTAYVIYGTSITPSVLAAFLWKRATATGATASIATGERLSVLGGRQVYVLQYTSADEVGAGCNQWINPRSCKANHFFSMIVSGYSIATGDT